MRQTERLFITLITGLVLLIFIPATFGKTEVRNQKSEVRGQKSEFKEKLSSESDLRTPTSELRLQVKRLFLPKGLKVLLVERHDLPIVAVNLLIKAGSKEEPSDRAGLASLTAQMLSHGTPSMNAEEISEEFEFVGASFSAETEYDYTLLSLYTLKKDIKNTFNLFIDMVKSPTFPIEEFNKKKAILISSLQKRNEEPGYVAIKTLRKELFKDHPYGRLVDGTPETIEKITMDDLKDFHNRFYRPERSILVVVGDINEKELKALLKGLEDWTQKFSATEKTPPFTHSPKNFSNCYFRHLLQPIIIDRELTQANILFGLPGISRKDPDYYTASVLNYILGGGGFSSRLVQKIRDEMGLAYDISSYFTVNEEPGLFVIELQTKNEQAKTAIEVIKKEIERLLRDGVTDEELEDAKAYLTGSLLRRLDTTKKIADFLTLAEFFELGDDYIKKYPELIRSVTKDDIIKTARRLLKAEGLIVIVGKKKAIGL
jgi:zinc protease